MKEATGELNMTVVTIIAIGAMIACLCGHKSLQLSKIHGILLVVVVEIILDVLLDKITTLIQEDVNNNRPILEMW